MEKRDFYIYPHKPGPMLRRKGVKMLFWVRATDGEIIGSFHTEEEAKKQIATLKRKAKRSAA